MPVGGIAYAGGGKAARGGKVRRHQSKGNSSRSASGCQEQFSQWLSETIRSADARN
eukprot:gene1198-biopygen7050